MRAVDHASDAKGRILDLQLIRRLWPYLRPHSGTLLLALAVMPVLTLVELGRPYLLKVVVDEHLVPGRAEGLWAVALVYLGLLVAQSILSFLYSYLTQRAGQLGLSDVRRAVFRGYQAFSMKDLDQTPVGALMTRATTDIESLNQMFQSGLLAMLSDLTTMAGILVLMAWLEWRLTALMLLVLPLAYATTDWFQKRMRQQFRVARAKLAAMNAFVQENVSGIRVVHLFDLEDEHHQRFRTLNEEYRDAYHASNLYDASLFSSMELTGSLCVALFLFAGAHELAVGMATLGVLVAFIEYMGRFFAPLRDLSSKLAVMQAAMAAAEKVVGVLDHQPEIADPEQPEILPPGGRGRVEFRGVGFHYRADAPVLRDLSFVVEPGEKVAVVGATGAGKTTVIKLLERFYDPTSGAVLLDGVDLRRLRIEDLRSQLAVVLQDVFLVRGTVAENIRLGSTGVGEARIQAACRAVEADAFIRRMPGGYQADIQEGASNLSSGERQLLSFARALVRDPRVLILDEATANVDVETEARVQRALATVLEGRTAIVIAHRLSTIRSCDRVLVMQRGELIEAGRHEELVGAGGVYSKLYQLQEKDGAPRAHAG